MYARQNRNRLVVMYDNKTTKITREVAKISLFSSKLLQYVVLQVDKSTFTKSFNKCDDKVVST